MDKSTSKPSILAITKDSFILRNIRLTMPLLNLKMQGLIQDYFITNPLLFDVPDDFIFDTVWLQKMDDPDLLQHLTKKINNHYLYDLDDLLIGHCSYRGSDLVKKEWVVESIRQCRVLTVSSYRLLHSLEKYTGVPLQEKCVICPNAGEFPAQIRVPVKPVGIILTSSDALALTSSFDSVMDALADFSDRHNLPIYYFGKPDSRIKTRFLRMINMGLVPYWHYHALLAALPPMIGVSPLETMADQDTLDFISCKSDIKMIDFGGFGHPSVYSDAPPYLDTDLKVGIVTSNTTQAWRAGLEAVYGDRWHKLAAEQIQVRELRNMNRIAAEFWYKAIMRARLPRRLTGKEIKFSTCGARFFIHAFRHLVYCQDYVFKKRLQAKIPNALLKIVKRFY